MHNNLIATFAVEFENNLKNTFGWSREQTQTVLIDCGIDLKARGETLSAEQFAQIADYVTKNNI